MSTLTEQMANLTSLLEQQKANAITLASLCADLEQLSDEFYTIVGRAFREGNTLQ